MGDATYVGETGRRLEERMQEHKKDIISKKKVSKVAEHANDHNHSFDFDNVKVVAQATNVRHLEAIHTATRTNTINRCLDIDNTYKPILEEIRKARARKRRNL